MIEQLRQRTMAVAAEIAADKAAQATATLQTEADELQAKKDDGRNRGVSFLVIVEKQLWEAADRGDDHVDLQICSPFVEHTIERAMVESVREGAHRLGVNWEIHSYYQPTRDYNYDGEDIGPGAGWTAQYLLCWWGDAKPLVRTHGED